MHKMSALGADYGVRFVGLSMVGLVYLWGLTGCDQDPPSDATVDVAEPAPGPSTATEESDAASPEQPKETTPIPEAVPEQPVAPAPDTTAAAIPTEPTPTVPVPTVPTPVEPAPVEPAPAPTVPPTVEPAEVPIVPEPIPTVPVVPEPPPTEPAWESICVSLEGTQIPYDYTRGIMAEFSFELSMSCSLGGYIMPLVEADPMNLTEVDIYAAKLTSWFRKSVLLCESEKDTEVVPEFSLLPVAQSGDMSDGDFDNAIVLFLSVVGHHDDLPDGMSPSQKADVKKRLNSFRKSAVKKSGKGATKPLPGPECIETPADGEGAS